MSAYNTVMSGQVQGGTTAAQMPDVPCVRVNIKALADNSGNVYIGGSGVTKAGSATSSAVGFELDAGQETGWIEIDNLNKFWMITDNNADDVSYIAFK